MLKPVFWSSDDSILRGRAIMELLSARVFGIKNLQYRKNYTGVISVYRIFADFYK